MKEIQVAFISEKLKKEFEELIIGKYEDKELYNNILNAINDLQKDRNCGIIPRSLWPKVYSEKYNIKNLWKYDLPKGWRLVYIIKEDEITIINIILEWFDHKEYEKRFNY